MVGILRLHGDYFWSRAAEKPGHYKVQVYHGQAGLPAARQRRLLLALAKDRGMAVLAWGWEGHRVLATIAPASSFGLAPGADLTFETMSAF